ncbi:unnamed protein product [Caenorhabditis angaria]|uniref:Uncharacterized protein n=1 Tax=Caenorhabditis angaria TaxID=860376 RepID=A0A9P1IRL1_9PELO|nr:unnamed protein product [Caenorhabditis angaria]
MNKILIFLFIFVFIIYFALFSKSINLKQNSRNIQKLIENETDDWNICHFPKYDAWDDEIMKFIDPDSNSIKNCDKNFEILTELKNSTWSSSTSFMNEENCRARCHRFKSETENSVDNWTNQTGPVDCEILETVCSDENGTDIYGWLHSQIIETPLEPPKMNISGLKQFDVVVIMIDSLSYTQAIRSLPRTLSYFKNHLKAVEFPYMNKVGENSRPNGAALWFGKSMLKLDRSFFKEPIIKEDWNDDYFCDVFKDNETHLFREFKEYGYKTMLAEDWAAGLMTYPNCKGFRHQPSDHYMKPFQNAYEKYGENLTKKHLKGKFCREHHHSLLDYLQQFQNSYENIRKFSWIWAIELGHYYQNSIFHADRDFHKYLMENRAKLENSFVFLMADHGFRYGDILDTKLGRIEKNNPLTAISIPKELRETTEILEIMRENSRNLQTHYDTRATFLDILKYQSKSGFSQTQPLNIPGEKGNSLLRHQPKDFRNCQTLPIPKEFCICQFETFEADNTTKLARNVGSKVIEEVNLKLNESGFSEKCVEMQLENVTSLIQYKNQYKGSILYTVTVLAKKPSEAIFKANIIVNKDSDMELLGIIERVSKYGKTADCIESEIHRPYCYCREQK